MREIKFRAYVKETEEMYKVIDLDIGSEQVALKGLLYLRNFDEVELMQYTGLRDQNGIEIYEGDILRDEADGEEYGVVEFNEGSFVVCWRGAYIIQQLLSEVHDSCCIMGNIYEDPELIQDKKDEH